MPHVGVSVRIVGHVDTRSGIVFTAHRVRTRIWVVCRNDVERVPLVQRPVVGVRRCAEGIPCAYGEMGRLHGVRHRHGRRGCVPPPVIHDGPVLVLRHLPIHFDVFANDGAIQQDRVHGCFFRVVVLLQPLGLEISAGLRNC